MWVTGVLSGLIAGAIALLAGRLNDVRLARRQQRERVQDLCAIVLAAGGKILDVTFETQVRRLESPDAPGLDWDLMHGYEHEYARAYIALSWLIGNSPLWPLLEEFDTARTEVVRQWAKEHTAYTQLHDAARDRLLIFEGAVEYFARLSPNQARDYLRSVRPPKPPPAGARPPQRSRGRWRRPYP